MQNKTRDHKSKSIIIKNNYYKKRILNIPLNENKKKSLNRMGILTTYGKQHYSLIRTMASNNVPFF